MSTMDERVSLRPVELRDAPSIQRYASDPRVAATTHVPHPYPANGATEFVRGCMAGRDAGTQLVSAILLDGEVVGTIALNGIDHKEKRARLDYSVAPEFWNKGVGTAAAKLAVEIAFNQLNLLAVYSSCLRRNIGSSRVLEKAGFEEGEPSLHVGRYGGERFKGEPVRNFRLVRTGSQWKGQ